jgi:alanine racemase
LSRCIKGNIFNASHIFSHLAGADEGSLDEFSKEQASRFEHAYEKICDALKILPLMHLLNSTGIIRLPEFQYDMVRLGIGLYGIDPSGVLQNKLRPVATFKTVISQIKKVSSGETIGYGRKGVASSALTVATLAIGYADGYSRSFSNGIGEVLIRGKKAPVIGNVCMDMMMVDVTHIADVSEGDEAIIFGNEMPIQQLASKIDTIPYEILTNTSERVKRVFYAESL